MKTRATPSAILALALASQLVWAGDGQELPFALAVDVDLWGFFQRKADSFECLPPYRSVAQGSPDVQSDGDDGVYTLRRDIKAGRVSRERIAAWFSELGKKKQAGLPYLAMACANTGSEDIAIVALEKCLREGPENGPVNFLVSYSVLMLVDTTRSRSQSFSLATKSFLKRCSRVVVAETIREPDIVGDLRKSFEQPPPKDIFRE